jgi:hypothetical protein
MVKGRVKVDGDTDIYLNAYRRGISCRLAPNVDKLSVPAVESKFIIVRVVVKLCERKVE